MRPSRFQRYQSNQNYQKNPPKFNINTAKRLLKYVIMEYRKHFVLVLCFILFSSSAGVIGSMFLRILIDQHITPLLYEENPVFSRLLWVIIPMGVIYILGIISTYVYNRQMIIIGQGVQRTIRNDMFRDMQKLPVQYFDTNSHGNIMSRYTNDISTLRQMVSQSLPMVFASCVSVVFMFFAMLFTSIHLTALVIVMIFFILKVSRKIVSKSGSFFYKQQSNLGNINGYIEEIINGQKVVKVFSYENEAKKEFTQKSHELFESAFNANKYANVMMPVMGNLSNLSYVLVAIVGSALALKGIGNLSLGAIASFLQLTKSFNRPITQMSQQLNSLVMALAGAERIFSLMDQKPEEDIGTTTLVNVTYDKNKELIESSKRTGLWAWKSPQENGTFTYKEVKGDIVFRNVDFSYDNEQMILHDISFYAKPGNKIAFVGATGAGKTTITSLINGFYDILDGKILYDGIDINKIKKSDLRRSIGVVLQETHLFTGTVMENIRFGNLDATDDEVINAAKLVGADRFICRLPDGYDTVLKSDGSTLSQGQRQLLSIARVAVANPPVMILDEATSSIDTRTEKLVQRGMNALMEGRTVLVIAHRLSTIEKSDAIMVLDKGRIVERGNHKELLDNRGIYYQLSVGAYETVDDMNREKSKK